MLFPPQKSAVSDTDVVDGVLMSFPTASMSQPEHAALRPKSMIEAQLCCPRGQTEMIET
jgi:hypothetical protein